MLEILLLLACGKLQEHIYEETSRAWQWAVFYAAIILLPGLGNGLPAALIGAVVMGLYAWGYFALLRQVADNLLLWLLVFLGGALLPFLISVSLLQASMEAAGTA